MIIVFGSTAVGKTDFSLQLAEHIPLEIINMDVGQLYKPLSIGTAKPDWQNSTVPHYLFDVVDDPKNFTVAAYRKLLLEKLELIWQKNKIPLVVGGSGFYLKSILFPLSAETEKIDAHSACLPYKPGTDLWHELYKIDSDRALEINKNDSYRIERALNIWHTTQKKPSLYVPEYKPPAPYLAFFLTRRRQELYERINSRVCTMIEDGWLEEVRSLLGTPWEQFLRKKKLIGYNELIEHLNRSSDSNPLSLLQTIKAIQKRTRRYARKQNSFWKMLERQVMIVEKNKKNSLSPWATMLSVDLTLTDLSLYIKQLKMTIPMLRCA